MRRASRLLLGVALLAGGLTVAGGPGGAIRPSLVARAAAAGTGGTTVSVQGTVVMITVNIDLCCLSMSKHDSAQLAELVQQAAAIWNDAFAKLPYKGCLTLHLAVNAHVLSPYNRNWEPGFDQIDAHFSDGRPGIIDPDPAATSPNVDTTSAYTQVLAGDYYLPNMEADTWAHEIGHLMGLGDDYTDVKDANGVVTTSVPLPGRAGTIMADHTSPPDQTVVNRIGDLVAKAGTKLPKCPETWTGTMSLAGSTTDPAGTVCREPGTDFTISFTSASDGTVQGKGRYHGSPYTCVSQMFGSYSTPPDKGTFTIEGRRTDNQFLLRMTGVSGSKNFGAFWPYSLRGWTLPIHGERVHTVIPGASLGQTLPGHVTLTVDLTCSGCAAGSS
jgi:hypothetical protein